MSPRRRARSAGAGLDRPGVAGEPGTVPHLLLAGSVAAAALVLLAMPPLAQPLDYHAMADERTWLGIPNALNVLSNLPFAVVGIWGLRVTFRAAAARFHDGWERWPWVALFTGVTLTTFGSAYYHLEPDNARLVWDRLPMTVGFMGLLAALLAERVSLLLARRLFVPLLVAGAASVVYWYWTELAGRGDLRPYILVQFGTLLVVVLLVALYRGRGGAYILAGLALYGLAKLFELTDGPIFSATAGLVSGHTLKHLTAAAAVACLLRMLTAGTRVRASGEV